MSKFIRPLNLSFPQIYHQFKATSGEGDDVVEFVIKDLPEEDYDRAVKLMLDDFIPDETICFCGGLAEDPIGREEMGEFWHGELKNKISIGCYENNDNQKLAGVTVLAVHSKDDPEEELPDLKSEVCKNVLSALSYVESQVNVYAKYNVDKFLTDYGICVDKSYRKRGIATEFLIARNEILRSLNMRVTSSVFTGIGSQKAAVKANYYDVYSIKWMDVGKKFPAIDFSKSNVEYCRIMDYVI